MGPRSPLRRIHRNESGSALIEVIVSGILLVIVMLGVFTAFDASTRSTAEERHRARAHSLAEADLSRMRSMRISDLSNLNQTATVTQDETPYTINSTSQYQTDSTGTATCEAGVSSADYIKVSSSVTWPSIGSRPPVVATTLVAPPNGSISANSGALAIGVENSQNVGIAGVGLTGTGAGSFSGTTGPDGCAVFGNLPAGAYTLSVSGVASGLVDKDGNPPGSVDTSVVGESTNTVVLQYDDPGSIPVSFTTRSYAGTVVPSSADSLLVFHSLMTAAKTFPPTVGARFSTITASPLFPFSSDYAVYAGTCTGDNPNPFDTDPPPAPLAIGSVPLSPGATQPTTIQLPALHQTVWSGTSSSSPGSRVEGATVKLWDNNCSNFLRTYTGITNAQGQLPDPGVPFSDYTICAQGVVAGSTRHRTHSLVSMNDPVDVTGGQTLNSYLQGFGTFGECP